MSSDGTGGSRWGAWERRGALAMAVWVASAVAVLAPPAAQRVEASSTGVITGTCGHAVNPDTTVNSSTAVIDGSRPWANIRDFQVSTMPGYRAPNAGAPAAAPSRDALLIQIDLCGPIPGDFPTANGDLGVVWMVSFQVPNSYPCGCGIFGGPNPQRVGTGHRGEPIFDGPFPPWEGYRYFAYYDVQTVFASNYGVGWYDPAGTYTVLDTEQMTHTPTGDNADPAMIYAHPGGTSVEMVLPSTWWWSPPPHLQGDSNRWLSERIYSPGIDQLTGITAQAFVATRAIWPLPLCTPQLDCITSAGGAGGVEVDAVPGGQYCLPIEPGVPVADPTTCVSPPPLSYDLGSERVPAAVPTPLDFPDMTNTIFAGTYTYYPCQPSDSWPSGIPGQGNGQDAGDLYTTAPQACSGPLANQWAVGTYQYASIWGRIPVRGAAHYVPNGITLQT